MSRQPFSPGRAIVTMNQGGKQATMTDTAAADPRLALIDLDVLDLDLFPPIAEWDDEDWAEAYELTMSAHAESEMQEGGRRWTPLEEFEAELDTDSAAAG